MRAGCAFILSATLTLEVYATSFGWHGEPAIKSIKGSPAICLPSDAKDGFPVIRVILSESYLNNPQDWTIRLKRNATPLTLNAGECLVFSDIPDGYELDTTSKLKKLQKNTTYIFMMDRVNDAKHYNHFYSSSFCIEGNTKDGYQYAQYTQLPNGEKTIPACDSKSKRDTPTWEQ